jgi:hypothetical protein
MDRLRPSREYTNAFKFSDGYKSTMDWCSVYLTPQALPKYIYLSPALIFPTTYNGIRTKNRPVWFTPGAAPIRWMGPIRNPRWEQKGTEGYVIVSRWSGWTHIYNKTVEKCQVNNISGTLELDINYSMRGWGRAISGNFNFYWQ